MTHLVSSIEWDTDDVTVEELGLPTEVSVDIVAECIDSDEKMANWLSDRYGWAVIAFVCDPPIEREVSSDCAVIP